MAKRVTKRGPRVTEDELYHFLNFKCGSRCLDSHEDLEAVLAELLYHFRLYHKVEVKR